MSAVVMHEAMVDGRTVRWYDAGDGPAPTIVLESGLGHSGVIWAELQTRLAASARVIAYDRAGYGGSSPGRGPRTAQALAEELSAFLTTIDAPGPYLLVGHSWGGVIVRCFAAAHPDAVAGLVLLDATHEDQPQPSAVLSAVMTRIASGAAHLSIVTGQMQRRLRDRGNPAGQLVASLPQDVREVAIADNCSHRAVDAAAAEASALTSSMKGLRAGLALPAVPFVAITGGKANTKQEEQFRARLADAYGEMAGRIPSGRHVVAPNSGHMVAQEDTDLVAAEISAVHAGCLARNQSRTGEGAEV